MKLFTKKNKLIIIFIALAIVIGSASFVIHKYNQPLKAEPHPDWEKSIAALDIEQESFFIKNGDVQLEADLFIPKGGEAKKGAVIFSTGSGNVIYQNYGHKDFLDKYIHDVFLSRDIAVLYINKRGMGKSEGNWMHNNFQGRANDIYKAVEYLQKHPSIASDKIGLIGHSQGGWIVTLAAAEHKDIAFFINLAGPSTTVSEQIRYNDENKLACNGYGEEEITDKLNKEEKWNRFWILIGNLIPIGESGFVSNIIDYDPQDALQKVEQPGLFVFGERDLLVPPKESLKRFEEIFKNGLPENLSIEIVEDTDHSFSITNDDCSIYTIISPEEFDTKTLSNELSKVLNTWLEVQGY